jgi:hypothetical protein
MPQYPKIMTCPAVLCLKWWQSDNVSHEVMLSFSSADGSCVSSCRTVSWNRYTQQRSSEWHGWTGGWNTTSSTLLEWLLCEAQPEGDETWVTSRFWVWSQSRMKSLLFCFNATHRGVVVIPGWGSKPYMVQAVMKTKIMTQPQIGDSTGCTACIGGDEDPNQDQLQIGRVIKVMTELQICDQDYDRASDPLEYFMC